MVLPAYKGRSSVVLDADTYHAKLSVLIDSDRTSCSTKIRQNAWPGNPVSADIGNLYMEIFEEQAIESAPCKA